MPVPVPITLATPRTDRLPSVSKVTVFTVPAAPITVSIDETLSALLASSVTVSEVLPSPVPITVAMPRTLRLPSVSRVRVSWCRCCR